MRKNSLHQIELFDCNAPKKLLNMFPDDKVDFIWFTDEKVFTVSSPRNPVDYKIWGIVQQRVYQSRVHDVDQLKQRLLDV